MADIYKGTADRKTVTIDGDEYPRLSLSQVREKLRMLAKAYQMPELAHLAVHLERKLQKRKKSVAPSPTTPVTVDPTDRKMVELYRRNHPSWGAAEIAAYANIKERIVAVCLNSSGGG